MKTYLGGFLVSFPINSTLFATYRGSFYKEEQEVQYSNNLCHTLFRNNKSHTKL